MKKIAVTGATGFVGRAVVEALRSRGDEVTALVRDPAGARFGAGVAVKAYDVMSGLQAPELFEGLDAVIHLAGEPVAGRWTHAKKRAIWDSRVLGTRNLVRSMLGARTPPRAFVAASAVGYYGSRGDEPLEESAAPGHDFLADVCVEWERDIARAGQAGMRAVWLRQGIVLGHGGGALAAMLPPYRAGVGGPLGNGKQFVPWIHLADDVAMFLFAVDHDALWGPLNAVSPDYATSARFAYALGHALRRPALLPAPAIALRLMLGQFASSVLASQLVIPARAEDAGFTFGQPSLEEALLAILDPGSGRGPATSVYRASQRVAAPLSRVFAFFSDAANLQKLTPQTLDFRIETPIPIEMGRGATIAYSLRINGFRVKWKTLIARWQPQTSFVDFALRGPYSLWRHTHAFTEVEGGVVIGDRVDYALPAPPLGNIALPWVRASIDRIFEYRRQRIDQFFGASSRS
ncbi:MAG: TIGR01777 family oxidoreductase [Candidatus Eremiobacteraeota bacterium]|nr:TIGR01777 family oxidoreductase [Candidatus Eremiobacteraeota bacterium]